MCLYSISETFDPPNSSEKILYKIATFKEGKFVISKDVEIPTEWKLADEVEIKSQTGQSYLSKPAPGR